MDSVKQHYGGDCKNKNSEKDWSEFSEKHWDKKSEKGNHWKDCDYKPRNGYLFSEKSRVRFLLVVIAQHLSLLSIKWYQKFRFSSRFFYNWQGVQIAQILALNYV